MMTESDIDILVQQSKQIQRTQPTTATAPLHRSQRTTMRRQKRMPGELLSWIQIMRKHYTDWHEYTRTWDDQMKR